MRDWSSFGLRTGLLSGPRYVPKVMLPPVQNTTRRTDKQQMQSLVRKVATLARTGEKGRALAAARNAPPVPVTEQIVQEIKSLHPADPEPPRDLFGREEALRMGEEIMDFQWSEHVTWDSIKDLRGTTNVQPPTRFRFALQQAHHAILRAIIHNNPPPWPQSQLGKRWYSAAGSSWDDPQSTPLRVTAHISWMHGSNFSGLRIGLLSGPWYVLNVMPLRCRTQHADRISSRYSHVFAKLPHWLVLVRKDEPWQLPEMHH